MSADEHRYVKVRALRNALAEIEAIGNEPVSAIAKALDDIDRMRKIACRAQRSAAPTDESEGTDA